MKELAKSYIQKRIEHTLNRQTNDFADTQAKVTRETRAKLARDEAQRGNTKITARHLQRDVTLAVSQKGEILAEAYANSAKRSMTFANNPSSPRNQERYQKEAQRSERISQGLTRAAQRSQNS